MSIYSGTIARGRSGAAGFTLVELMVALLLGLIVVGSALAIFSSNKQTYVATESLGRMQENTRVAFELMSRDIREAGGSPCSKTIPVANILNSPGSAWWSNWTDPIKGYGGTDTLGTPAFGTAAGTRVSGTDAVELKSTFDSGVTVVDQPSATSANFKVSSVNHGLQDNDIVMVCDYRQATILQVTNASSSSVTVVHNPGAGTPGNCSKGMGVPTVCTTNGTPYVYSPNSVLAKLHATRWYIGNNPLGGRSLYQSTAIGGGVVTQEIAEGVTNMTLQYLLPGATNYAAAAAGTSWKDVVAVRITLALQGNDRVNGNVLIRSLSHVVTLRNRAS